MKHNAKRIGLVAATILLLAGTMGFAQYWGYGYGYGSYYHASTAQESIARGMADMVRAASEARLRQSEAAKNYQEARTKALENRLRATEIYYERRRLGKETREAQRHRPARTERTFRRNRSITPPLLGPSELDPLTGAIHWPVALRATGFGPERRVLEELFAQRATNEGYLASDDFEQIQETGKHFQERLKQRIRTIPTGEYIQASKFLKSLLYEPRRSSG